uniref:Ribosomal RNA-processing protein 8 n=1 Tax=Hyalomma excavatum TaxID=257692 RepID=A0A131XDF7_9ACAR
MNVAQVSSHKKRKGCSPLESKCEYDTDLKCKRPRFADKRQQEAKANHGLDVTSLKPPQKRKGAGQASDYTAKKKKAGLETIVENNAAAAFRPRERKKKVACQLKKQAPSARGDDADEAQLIEELRSGVTSILRGLEPEETSSAASRVAKTRLRDSVGGAIESEKRKKKRKKKKRKCSEKTETPTHGSSGAYPKGTSTLPTNEKVKKQKATGNMKEASKAEEEARRSFSDFTLEEREPLASTHSTAINFDTDQEVSRGRQTVGKQIDPSLGAGKASSKKRRAFYLASSADVRERALARIRAAQFRMLNEELYTTASEDAVQSFESDPQSFQVYHEGFEQQVSKWPVNPVDVIIESLYSMPKSTVIADLGCGEAKIAQALTRNKVHSFDIVALNEHVTICDMSKLPLPNQTIDVAVFCLSLMGTNLNMFVLEANRILKKGGILKIAEVKSRFSTTQGFAKTMKKFGFELEHLDDSNKMFVLFDFKKVRSTTAHPHLPTLKLMPCLYKKR